MEVPIPISDFLRRAVRLYPQREAVVSGGLRFTYAQFDERVNRLAHALRDLGVQKGDRVALLSPNAHQFLECFYGVTAIDAVLVPLNYRLVPSDFTYIINHAEATVFIVDAELAALAAQIRPELTSVRHTVMWSNDGSPVPGDALDYEDLLARGAPLPPPDPGLRVVGEDGRDVPMDVCTIGEVVARGNVVLKGYWRQPEETDKMIVDGWFHTGDLAACPTSVDFVESLPRTATGKLQKFVLRERSWAGFEKRVN